MMKIKIPLIIFSTLLTITLIGQPPSFEWVKSYGGTQGDYGEHVAIDAMGNVYTTGYFKDSVDFDPGPEEFILASNGYRDAYVTKFDANGQFLWAVAWGGEIDDDYGYGIDVDQSGNVFITGSFVGTVDFDPGQAVYNMSTSYEFADDIFVLKLSTHGSFLWAHSFGSGNQYTNGEAVVVDEVGDVYITGRFRNTVDFDPGPGSFELGLSGDRSIIFVLKLSSEGEFVWAEMLYGPKSTSIRDITLDHQNNLYIIGSQDRLIANDQELFIVKFNHENGNIFWTKKIPISEPNQFFGMGIRVDEEGSIYATGTFSGTVEIDSGTETMEISGVDDIFIIKLDSNANVQWAKSVGGSGYDIGRDLDIDSQGNVYITGYYHGSVDFDPGPGVFWMSTSPSFQHDAFILKLDSDGLFLWANRFSSIYSDSGNSLVIDDNDYIYMTGYFSLTVDFNPLVGVNTATSNGNVDVFVLKLSNRNCDRTPVIRSSNNSFELCANNSLTLFAELPEWAIIEGFTWSTGETTDSIIVMPESDIWYTVSANYMIDTLVCMGSDSVLVSTNDVLEIPQELPDLVIDPDAPTFQVTIPEVTDALAYFWEVPTNVQIITGANTNTLTAAWGGTSLGGEICVSAFNECGIGPAACMEVLVDLTNNLSDLDNFNVSIFPNPAHDILEIVFNDDERYTIALHDLFGRVVIGASDYHQTAQLQTSNLPVGMYWLKISRGDESVSKIIIKE